jgi:hypothetical protein
MFPTDAFAGLGAGKLAYVRQIRSEELTDLFPDAPPVMAGLKLWALSHANGQPILISDSRETAIANAAEHNLLMVSVH